MGRKLPSATQLAFEQIAELQPLYGALRRSDQLILDQFFEDILGHRAAIANVASLLPLEILPYVILLEERKRSDKVHAELSRRLAEQEHKLLRLLPSETEAD